MLDSMTSLPVANMSGFPMADVGLEDAVLRWPDGTVQQVGGFICYPGMTIIGSLLHQIPPMAEVFADRASLLANIPVRVH